MVVTTSPSAHPAAGTHWLLPRLEVIPTGPSRVARTVGRLHGGTVIRVTIPWPLGRVIHQQLECGLVVRDSLVPPIRGLHTGLGDRMY